MIELVELRELGTARTLLRQTNPTQLLRDQFPDRYLHLEHLLSRSHFDAKDAYPNGQPKEKRRQIIAQALSSEVTVVAPSRLLTLLGQSLKFQEQQGMLPPDSAYDLFRGTVPVVQAETDDVPSKCYNTIKVTRIEELYCVVHVVRDLLNLTSFAPPVPQEAACRKHDILAQWTISCYRKHGWIH